MITTDQQHMAHALRLARRGLGNVWPNPAVGCVLVKNGRIIGRGWTQPGGRPHAERIALDQAGKSSQGATAYVTLEPCAHFGKTPPCAQALIDGGIARVVTALGDPDPRVLGRGHDMLREAGITVTEGVLENEARKLQAGFLLRITANRPFITLKLASSFDARIATAGGESQWITGPAARRHVHMLRLMHDAIMVGGKTARADRPSLNIRDMGPVRQPVRIILSSGSLPQFLLESAEFGPLWQVSGDIHDVLHELAQRGITRVFCEGGGHVAAQLLRDGYVDQLVGYTAGMVLGGDARAAVGPFNVQYLSDAPRYKLIETRKIGVDLFHRWLRVRK